MLPICVCSHQRSPGGSTNARLRGYDLELRRCVQRAGAADPKALVDAIRTTSITDNVSMGPGIQFNENGQNDKLKNGAIQASSPLLRPWLGPTPSPSCR